MPLSSRNASINNTIYAEISVFKSIYWDIQGIAANKTFR